MVWEMRKKLRNKEKKGSHTKNPKVKQKERNNQMKTN
jgi:hypothetical protein